MTGHSSQAGWLAAAVMICAASITGCGQANTNQTAGMAVKSLNTTVGQPLPPQATDVHPVQLVQFDHRSKTVRIVVTTLPVDERGGSVGQTRDFSEYRQTPLAVSVPVGWSVHAIVPDKEPWLLQSESGKDSTLSTQGKNLKHGTHHIQLNGPDNSDYQLLVSNLNGPAERLAGIHFSNHIQTPLLTSQARSTSGAS